MGIQSAMYSGVRGLNTNAQAMSVIGNNLANTNTIGFKGARSIFADLLSSSVRSSGQGFSQVGRGVGVSTIDNVFSQGTFETTSSNTDVAIEGDGFFLLKEPEDETVYYSRAGAFRFNEEGFLTNPEGLHVQGKSFDAVGNLLPGDPQDIQVLNVGLIPARATETMTYNTNLDADSAIPAGGWAAWNPDDTTTYNYTGTTQVFDSLGEGHLTSVYWRVTDPVTNTWEWFYDIPDAGLQAAGAPGLVFNADGTLPDVDGDGFPDPVVGNINGINWGNGSDPSDLELNFDCTQFDSQSVVIAQDQDGFTAGNMTNITINNDGIVIANYSNGERTNIAQLVLGKFKNPNGLFMEGSNLYTASNESGAPRVGLPGPELGKIFTSSLEQSNVDMGQEFVKMITVQRGFQANSKIITTVDELLGELINLKR
ncbi:MAG: flagellar hook-basal body complex protein [Desulfobulbaceae bacterium]|nr:flagellar hook-basal body complex protein [Desulfobulbaceae bacterium]